MFKTLLRGERSPFGQEGSKRAAIASGDTHAAEVAADAMQPSRELGQAIGVVGSLTLDDRAGFVVIRGRVGPAVADEDAVGRAIDRVRRPSQPRSSRIASAVAGPIPLRWESSSRSEKVETDSSGTPWGRPDGDQRATSRDERAGRSPRPPTPRHRGAPRRSLLRRTRPSIEGRAGRLRSRHRGPGRACVPRSRGPGRRRPSPRTVRAPRRGRGRGRNG